jgi:hypothetical protein
LALPQIQEVVKGLQALRGIAQISALTIAAELGNISGKDRSCNRRLREVIRGLPKKLNNRHIGNS